MESIISTTGLLAQYKRKEVVIIEATSGVHAEEIFKDEHLHNAKLVDLDLELSSAADPKFGGRHPLPDINEFSVLLGKLGITPENHVIVYDRANGANAAARFWWMLCSVGHRYVQVLSGGFDHAKSDGIPTDSGGAIYPNLHPYPVYNWKFPMADMKQVAEATVNSSSLIIDVREQRRFNGEIEPIDLIAGHIPNAVNIPLSNNLTNRGLFKSKEALQTMYAPYFLNKDSNNIIVHCGSGVTACHTILTLVYAGFPIPNLYVGSWSEWSRNNNPTATV